MHKVTRTLTIAALALVVGSSAVAVAHIGGSSVHTHTVSHSVIVGSYPDQLRCDSASQAINDPEDCQRLGSLKGLKPLDVQPDITIAPCTMTDVPAYTRTDVCIAADGSIVPRH